VLRIESPLILILPRKTEFISHFRTVNGHVPVIKGIPQTIINHRIDNAAIRQAHPRTPPHIRQNKRAIAHAFLTTGDTNISASQKYHLKSKVNCLDSRRTNFIDCNGRHGFRYSCKDCCLTARNLAATGRNNLPHKDIVHISWLHLAFGSTQNFLYRHRS